MKCPKCDRDTLVEIPAVGSGLLGKSYLCTNINCGHAVLASNAEGKTLGELRNQKNNDEEE